MSEQPQEEEKRQDIGSTKRGKKGIAMATSTASTIYKIKKREAFPSIKSVA